MMSNRLSKMTEETGFVKSKRMVINRESRRMAKVLAVDDNPDNLSVLEETIGQDYDLKIATNGGEALKIVDEFQPDVVLLDVMMPGIDGFEVCSQLRDNPLHEDMAIIMFTAKNKPQHKVTGHMSGANDYITKPFTPDEIRAAIEFSLKAETSSCNQS